MRRSRRRRGAGRGPAPLGAERSAACAVRPAASRTPRACAARRRDACGSPARRPARPGRARGRRRDRAAPLLRVDAVELRGVQPEDARLALLRERRVAELLLHGSRDLERLEGVDLPLGRAPPDRVGAPDDVLRAEHLEQRADEVRGRLRALEERRGEAAAELGVDALACRASSSARRRGTRRCRRPGSSPSGRRRSAGRASPRRARQVAAPHGLLRAGPDSGGRPLCTLTSGRSSRTASSNIG